MNNRDNNNNNKFFSHSFVKSVGNEENTEYPSDVIQIFGESVEGRKANDTKCRRNNEDGEK